MAFNSFVFLLLFFVALLPLQRALSRRGEIHPSRALLLVASLGFYAWGRPGNLFFLAGSILFNFTVAQRLDSSANQEQKRRWFILGVIVNLGFLAVFKYTGFAFSTLEGLTGLHLPAPGLPPILGISFFTLQQVMYLFDCFEGLAEPHGLLDHASFVAFFPYLISGPLVRSRQVIRHLREARGADGEALGRGLFLFAFGLAKKVVLADGLAKLADAGFSQAGQISGLEALLASVFYTLQIYFDFSGYSDMALGLARMLGVPLPLNFNSPFRATSMTEFWQRWHISLSAFITTYLYTPLVRSMGRATLAVSVVATLLAMTIAGLWHGPSWTFVFFGVVHGLGLALNQVWRKRIKLRVPTALAWLLTMATVVFAFIFFRSPSMAAGWSMVARMGQIHHWARVEAFRAVLRLSDLPVLGPGLLLAMPCALLGPTSNEWAERFRPGIGSVLLVSALLLISFLFMNSTLGQSFVYFAF